MNIVTALTDTLTILATATITIAASNDVLPCGCFITLTTDMALGRCN
jgi:hypothetical protein